MTVLQFVGMQLSVNLAQGVGRPCHAESPGTLDLLASCPALSKSFLPPLIKCYKTKSFVLMSTRLVPRPASAPRKFADDSAWVLIQPQMAVIVSSWERQKRCGSAGLCDRNKAWSDWLNPKLIYGWRRKCGFLTYIPTYALTPRQNSSGLILFQVISPENVLKSRRSLHSQHWHYLSECTSRCALFVCVSVCVCPAIYCLK